ncbi:cupin domain-containing protein [Mesorhizobium sp.]|uniref:cupin domain-containing protein n=1 Tax=Mesorhizobium sp. TaxID=1871066 RepID=UPI001215920D|nr:cupin domain-containing protein [Mesorhizobium sp.]TIL69765.1 MAG: cupin domain-containing protein [Mesorhizobium sp.]
MDAKATAAESFVREPAAGSTLNVLGITHIHKATGAETAGSFSLWESVVPPGAATPLHTHAREDEAFYVLSGELVIEFEGNSAPHPYCARRLLLRRTRPAPCRPQCRRQASSRARLLRAELRP